MESPRCIPLASVKRSLKDDANRKRRALLGAASDRIGRIILPSFSCLVRFLHDSGVGLDSEKTRRSCLVLTNSTTRSLFARRSVPSHLNIRELFSPSSVFNSPATTMPLPVTNGRDSSNGRSKTIVRANLLRRTGNDDRKTSLVTHFPSSLLSSRDSPSRRHCCISLISSIFQIERVSDVSIVATAASDSIGWIVLVSFSCNVKCAGFCLPVFSFESGELPYGCGMPLRAAHSQGISSGLRQAN
jgi:hypothetical protein